jgi:hypothetical protein
MAAGVVTEVPPEQRHHPQVIEYLDHLALAARIQVTGGASNA